jgi:diaminopropionate ammonia-lyase
MDRVDPQLLANRQAVRRPYGKGERRAISPELAARARADLRRWRGYAPTPLQELPALASELGVARIFAKDEGQRTELSSFKALGGAYALSVLLAREVSRITAAEHVDVEDLENGRFSAVISKITVTCASDGNHGRSLAWGARRFGCRCVIYLPASVSQFRAEAIERYGARTVRVAGNYDDAVRQAAAEARANKWLLVADTATATYLEPPQLVMAGYSLLADETWDQLSAEDRPTHVFAQVGCGGLAGILASYFWSRLGEKRPAIIGVEPLNAACLFETVRVGELVKVEGMHETVMGGLACGELSHSAWQILRGGLDFTLKLPDSCAIAAVRGLAAGTYGPPITAGESGAAGIAALLALVGRDDLKKTLDLTSGSRILTVVTEGATDPDQYRQILAGERQ